MNIKAKIIRVTKNWICAYQHVMFSSRKAYCSKLMLKRNNDKKVYRFSFFSSMLRDLRSVQGVSWILRHDKTWQNSHQWNARSKQQNGRLGWSSCDVRTRISSNLIKQCRWEENYGKKFLLLVAILHNTTTSWHTLVMHGRVQFEFRSYS